MSDRTKVNLLKYGITSGLGGLMVYIYCSSRDLFAMEGAELWRTLCDAFTIPGLTFIMVGFLVMIANEGFFDMFGYAFGKALNMFIPGRAYDGEKYYDYVQRKKDKRATGFGFLFVVGGVLMAFALLFMFLFNRSYNG